MLINKIKKVGRYLLFVTGGNCKNRGETAKNKKSGVSPDPWLQGFMTCFYTASIEIGYEYPLCFRLQQVMVAFRSFRGTCFFRWDIFIPCSLGVFGIVLSECKYHLQYLHFHSY